MYLTQNEKIVGCVLSLIGAFVYISMWFMVPFWIIVFIHMFIFVVGMICFLCHLEDMSRIRK